MVDARGGFSNASVMGLEPKLIFHTNAASVLIENYPTASTTQQQQHFNKKSEHPRYKQPSKQ